MHWRETISEVHFISKMCLITSKYSMPSLSVQKVSCSAHSLAPATTTIYLSADPKAHYCNGGPEQDSFLSSLSPTHNICTHTLAGHS